MSAPRDWTAENFAADLAFDEQYHGAPWAGADSVERNTAMQAARSFYRAGWRAHVNAQKSLDYCIATSDYLPALEGKVTDLLREGWQLAGSAFFNGAAYCQPMTRSD